MSIDAVVVVHRGESDYLEAVLRRLAKCGASRIILVGDQGPRFDFVERRSLDAPELASDLEEFRAVYQNWSDAGLEAERFCVERWFYIRNLWRAEGLTGCLALDSDVLLFCDLGEEAARFSEFAMTFARWDDVRNLVHCNFISRLDALESFCAFVLDVYKTPEKLEAIKEANRKKGGWRWVSDMSLFSAWERRNSDAFRFAFFEDFYRDGICFDDKITSPGAFCGIAYLPLLLRRYKRILYFRDGRPFGRLRDGRIVPFRALHYHGNFKFLIPDHAEGRHSHFRAFRGMIAQKLAKIPRQIRRNWEKYGPGRRPPLGERGK